MFADNVRGALNYLSRKSTDAHLKLNDITPTKDGSSETVPEALSASHSEASQLILMPCWRERYAMHFPVDLVVFTAINGHMIKVTALHYSRSAGPSGIDALPGPASSNLCNGIAGVAQRICTSRVSPSALNALLVRHFVPLNKNPGMHPIGVGDIVRRMIGKAIMRAVKEDVMFSAGPLQVCSSIPSGGEAAVHAARELFEKSKIKRVLLVDASNAFNSLNRKVTAHTTEHEICMPSPGNRANKLLPESYTPVSIRWRGGSVEGGNHSKRSTGDGDVLIVYGPPDKKADGGS